jgi:hypothetical protein
MKKYIFTLIFMFLTACSTNQNEYVTDPMAVLEKVQITNFQVNVNEDFEGEVSDLKKETIEFTWNITNSVEGLFYEIYAYCEHESCEDSETKLFPLLGCPDCGPKAEITEIGNQRILKMIPRFQNTYPDFTYFLPQLMNLYQSEEVDLELRYGYRTKLGKTEIMSGPRFTYKKPERFTPPSSEAQISYKFFPEPGFGSSEVCFYYEGPISFLAPPAQHTVLENGKVPFDSEVWINKPLKIKFLKDYAPGYEIKCSTFEEAGEKIKFEIVVKSLGNEIKSNVLEVTTPEPIRSKQEIKEGQDRYKKEQNQNEALKIEGCEDPLEITELNASKNDCGLSKVEVYQSDLNTGNCQFLGYWIDANGVEKPGLFSYCGNFRAGSYFENKTYEIYVRVKGTKTYETSLGTLNEVVEFEVIASK